MTDNNDGTYSYSFTIEKPGVISVYIFLSISNSINATVFEGREFETTPNIFQNWTELNWNGDKTINEVGTSNVIIIQSGNFSSYFFSPT